MDYSQLSNVELLQLVIGMRAARRLYRGTLEPLFARVSASIVTHVRFPVLHLASPIMLTSYRSAAAAPSEQNRIE